MRSLAETAALRMSPVAGAVVQRSYLLGFWWSVVCLAGRAMLGEQTTVMQSFLQRCFVTVQQHTTIALSRDEVLGSIVDNNSVWLR